MAAPRKFASIVNNILHNAGPWGDAPQNNPGNRPPQGPQGPQNLDDVLRQSFDRFKKMGGGNGGSGNNRGGFGGEKEPFTVILIAVVIAVGMWLGTGFYHVNPEENAVLLTFGKMSGTNNMPGLGYHLPWPVMDVVKVNVALDRRLEIGEHPGAQTRDEDENTTDDSVMLTGDQNIIDINFVVVWRISDAGNFLFKVRNPEDTIKKVAESAMRESIGRTEIQKAMTEARDEIEIDTKARMQKMLDEYESGVTISSVQLLRVDPPGPVVDAFDDVQRARSDLERLKNEAETYSNDIIPRARGDAQKTVQDAEAYKQAVITRAQGDANRFLSIYAAYAQSKDVTKERMYIESVQQVLQNSHKVILTDGKSPMLPYMPVNEPAAPAAAAK